MNLTSFGVNLGKSLVIAFAAAIASWLPWVWLNGMDLHVALGLFNFALLGCFVVGLPVALLCLWLAGKVLRNYPATVFLMANFAGAVLLLTSYLYAGEFGLLTLGLPSLLAANTFALLGWLWILRPMPAANQEPI